jgi:hypothetical protein
VRLERRVVAAQGVDEYRDHGSGLAKIDSGNSPSREHPDPRVLGVVVVEQSKSGDRFRCCLPQVSQGGHGADSDGRSALLRSAIK